jgi:N-methylhydantoinase A/oxoprolinase/acetone carboxylase beta subunit
VTADLRVGVDVGGTFTKAVAVSSSPLRIHAHASVPTSHDSAAGVADGLATVLRDLADQLGDERRRVRLVAFSTTQAMNALLEGDVGVVAVVGIGYRPDLRLAGKRTRVGAIGLAPGHRLATTHHLVDATDGLDEATVDRLLDEVGEAVAVAVSGAFSVDTPRDEDLVAAVARRRGLPACVGHELTGAYGLETRTVSAAINASVLPVVERTASMTEKALGTAGLDVPLLVLRGDGGSMSLDRFRSHPALTIGSAPAAGVAAVLHELLLTDAIVVECGGTSTNVSVIRRGRAELRSLKVMSRPTAIRAVDSWVVGAAGGSMALLKRRGIDEVGPRSAHIAGLSYASFAAAEQLAGARLELVAPRVGDPAAYACVDAEGGRFALTATCAANALGLVPEDAYPYASSDAALAAFAPLGERLRAGAEGAARQVLDGAVKKIAAAVSDAARHHGLAQDVPLVALGGAGAALVPEVARRLGREAILPDHAEVLSAVGAAASLVRAEVVRSMTVDVRVDELAQDAERSCIDAGAAPHTVAVETVVDNDAGVVRAVATGAVALQSGAVDHRAASERDQRDAAATALDLPGDALGVVAANEYYRVFAEAGSRRVAVVDRHGAVALADDADQLVVGSGEDFVRDLTAAVAAGSRQLGVATMLPRVSIMSGARLLDLSSANHADEIVSSAERLVAQYDDVAVAVVTR